MPSKPLLEVLIPTYRRPESVILGVQSILDSNDDRVAVRCHSNQHEPSLDEFFSGTDNTIYGNFETNRGPHQNSYKLLADTNAEFCMLLSDEDRICSAQLYKLLDYLQQLSKDCNVVGCSVFSEEIEDYIFRLPTLHLASLSLAGFTLLANSNYMSGYIFRVSALQNLNLGFFKGADHGPNENGLSHNVYSHIDIAQQLLKGTTYGLFMDKLVIQGEEVQHGGHAFCHRDSQEPVLDGNRDLNPAVYGPFARACQYFYRERLLGELCPFFPPYSFFLAQAKLFTFFLGMLIASEKSVRLQKDTSVRSEAARGVLAAKAGGYFSGSHYCNLFTAAIDNPSVMLASYNMMEPMCNLEALANVSAEIVMSEWVHTSS